MGVGNEVTVTLDVGVVEGVSVAVTVTLDVGTVEGVSVAVTVTLDVGGVEGVNVAVGFVHAMVSRIPKPKMIGQRSMGRIVVMVANRPGAVNPEHAITADAGHQL